MNTLRRLLITSVMGLFVVIVGLSSTPIASAASNLFKEGCTGNDTSAVCQASTTDTSSRAQSMVGIVINIILMIAGVIAVIMIIIGGIRYTLSNGDASSMQSAKNTILYAVIGLVIALLSFAIVNFVIFQFSR